MSVTKKRERRCNQHHLRNNIRSRAPFRRWIYLWAGFLDDSLFHVCIIAHECDFDCGSHSNSRFCHQRYLPFNFNFDILLTCDTGSGLTRKQRTLVISVIALMIYLGFGALIQTFLLDSTFLNALYFTVVSIETIGEFASSSPSGLLLIFYIRIRGYRANLSWRARLHVPLFGVWYS